MTELVLPERTRSRLEAYLEHPTHALLLIGPTGSGKGSLLNWLAGQLLGLEPHKLDSFPYLLRIGESDATVLRVEAIRQLQDFLSRKVPGGGRRVIIIEAAERLSKEAQNALLKTLEEPPHDTSLLLSAPHDKALLPTILSRVQELAVIQPTPEALSRFFEAQGATRVAVNQAALMSGNLPGLMHAMLAGDTEHPLYKAADIAKDLLRMSTFERLTTIDSLVADRQLGLQVSSMLQEIAHIGLRQGGRAETWQRVMALGHDASDALQNQGQPKLVWTELLLQL